MTKINLKCMKCKKKKKKMCRYHQLSTIHHMNNIYIYIFNILHSYESHIINYSKPSLLICFFGSSLLDFCNTKLAGDTLFLTILGFEIILETIHVTLLSNVMNIVSSSLNKTFFFLLKDKLSIQHRNY